MTRLAPADCCSEDIRVHAVIVAELELGNIERQVLFADFVEGSDAAALDQRPEAFDGLCGNRTNNILFFRVIDNGMLIFFAKMFVAYPLVGTEQADLVRDGFAHEGFKCHGAHVFDNAGDDIAFALHSANDWRLAGTDATRSIAAAALILVPVLGEAADEGLVYFNNAAELFDVLHQSGSDLVAHAPGGLVGTETHVTHDLQGAHALLADKHEMGNAKPVTEGLIRVFKDRAGDVGEPIAVRSAFLALPVPFAGWQVIDRRITATWAADALGPAASNEIGLAGFLVWKHRLELIGRKLMNRLGLLAIGHGFSPPMEGYCHV
jgi:hypothetical protein